MPSCGPLFILQQTTSIPNQENQRKFLRFLEPKLEALERPQAWVVGPKIAWVMFPSEIEALGNKRRWGHLFVFPGKHINGLLHGTVLHDCIAL